MCIMVNYFEETKNVRILSNSWSPWCELWVCPDLKMIIRVYKTCVQNLFYHQVHIDDTIQH